MLRLQDFMSVDVLTIDANTDADAASEQMHSNRIHHLAVFDNGELVGIVSDRDLGGPKIGASTGKKVRDLMTSGIVSASPRSTVREAANLLRGRAIGCLPVLDHGKLVGIVTVSDLLELLGKGEQRPIPNGERLSWTRKPRGKRTPVVV